MNKLPQISEAEFEVMKIVWKYAPISTNEITEKLLQTTSWSPKTIQTLIKRLVTKGVLTYEKQSRVFVYTPTEKTNILTKKVIPFLTAITMAILLQWYLLMWKMTAYRKQSLTHFVRSFHRKKSRRNLP